MQEDQFKEKLGCCACEEGKAELPPGISCADKQNIFTGREQQILAKIRESSQRAHALKVKIDQTDESDRENALRELEELRQLRAELEQERIAASEERMRLLGHL